MTTKTLSKSDLAQFTGSENWCRHGINRNVLYTDGAQHVAEHGGAYWLLDEIAIIQPYNKAVAAEEFQVWSLIADQHERAPVKWDILSFVSAPYFFAHLKLRFPKSRMHFLPVQPIRIEIDHEFLGFFVLHRP